MRIRVKTILILIIVAMTVPRLWADIAPGSWIVHPSFVMPAQNVVETSQNVYFLTGGSLFGLNKKNDEAISYVYGSPLNDWNITGIYPSGDNKSIVIAYENGNLDILDDNGDIVNIPDIKNASDLDNRYVYDVVSDGKTAYIAAGFGLVIADITTGRIKDSGRYGSAVEAVTLTNDRVYIVNEGKLYSMAKTDRINRFENFTSEGNIRNLEELHFLNGNIFLVRSGKLLSLGKIENGNFNEYEWIEILDKPLIKGSEGIYAVTLDNRLLRVNEDAIIDAVATAVQVGNDEIIGGSKPETEYWSIDKNGIVKMTLDNGTWISQSERFIPSGTLTSRSIDFIIPGSDPSRIYLGNIGATLYRNGATDGLDVIQQLTLIEEGAVTDRSASGVKGDFYNVVQQQEKHGSLLITPQRFAEFPADKNVYFIGTGNDGLYKIENRQFAGRYAGGNSPISSPWGYRVFEVSVDNGGNLWIGYDGRGNETGVAVLPAEKLQLPPSQVTLSDWFEIDIKGMPVDRDMRIYHSKKLPVTLIFNWNGEDGIIVIDNNSTPGDFADDNVMFYHYLVDQDGQIFTPERFTAITEDHNGHIWIGCEGGLIEISDPLQTDNSRLSVRRIKIGHDDGTGLADYFCGTDRVLDISIDGADRKWVTTEESGVYLLNKEGNTILHNFTKNNSPLASNDVKSVYTDPFSNSVYFGTSSGLIEYGNDATEPREDFSSVKVYPNPVTPQTAVNFVTISGLTDGAEVKITDSSGGLVWQGRFEGGMAKWPLENISGTRVRTGIYYVFLSSGSSRHSVAKIMIVN
ncbi:MAG: hypothetical protein J1E38_02010 [Paramuribaculum sp.]|nr:hypothetical protein [Paramuribaculum sp.]